nr:pentatricopeptide repeat-containing protein [Tanacetum cinerariifolium]
MIPGTDLHCFDVHNDGYFSHLPLTYVDGVILEMVVRRMPYKEFVVDLEEKDNSLNLYLDHLDMDLLEYLSQAITNEMDACVFKKISPPKKSYCNEFSMDEMVDWAEMEVKNSEDVETNTRNIDTGIDATDCVEARTSTTDKGKRSDDDSDYQSDMSVDYLSLDEEELIELRNMIKANREANAQAKDNPVSKINEPNNENSMHADNARGDTFEEHDIYMNKLLKSLNTADKDGITKDPFVSIKKHMERYPMYDETTHWRLRKPKVGEKYVSVAQFKKCLTYYALANGFCLWYERIGEVRVVGKCG